MPINKITSSKRGRAAIAAVMTGAVTIGGVIYTKEPEGGMYPAAVVLATDKLILPWEGMVLTSHWDRFAKIYDICAGLTRINGKPVQPGMRFTRPQCEAMTRVQIYNDYWMPLVKGVPGFTKFPVSVQAVMLSGAWNFGVGRFATNTQKGSGMIGSTATRKHMQGKYREGCEAQTAFNKAGGAIVNGLVKRREMGDAQRLGEAELCVSGL